jgi:hypothetical protein
MALDSTVRDGTAQRMTFEHVEALLHACRSNVDCPASLLGWRLKLAEWVDSQWTVHRGSLGLPCRK